MARTADRYLKKTVKTKAAPRIYDVGNYLRLSVDSDYTGSDSLQNQRKLAQEYVRQCPDLNTLKPGIILKRYFLFWEFASYPFLTGMTVLMRIAAGSFYSYPLKILCMRCMQRTFLKK